MNVARRVYQRGTILLFGLFPLLAVVHQHPVAQLPLVWGGARRVISHHALDHRRYVVDPTTIPLDRLGVLQQLVPKDGLVPGHAGSRGIIADHPRPRSPRLRLYRQVTKPLCVGVCVCARGYVDMLFGNLAFCGGN